MDGARGVAVWLTGLPCSGKSSIATLVAALLEARGRRVEVLDGDVVRTHLSKGLGFSREDRDTNVRRIGFVAHLLARNGVVVLVAAISPYAESRRQVRELIGDFIEVHVRCPLSECERRDVKGLYARARAGQIADFTGVSAPYEAPEAPDLVLDTLEHSPEQSAHALLACLERLGHFAPGSEAAASAAAASAAAASAAAASAAALSSVAVGASPITAAPPRPYVDEPAQADRAALAAQRFTAAAQR